MKKTLKLSQWARKFGYSYKGAWQKYSRGDIPNSYTDDNGRVFVEIEDEVVGTAEENTVAIYCRSHSSEDREDGKRQQQLLETFAATKGYIIKASVREIGSTLDDERIKLNEILDRNDYRYLLVESTDRLAFFGYDFLERYLKYKGVSIIVVNEAKQDEEEKVKELVELTTKYCISEYGRKIGGTKGMQIAAILKDEEPKK